VSPRQRADIASTMVKEFGVSVRNACRAVRLACDPQRIRSSRRLARPQLFGFCAVRW
jgi:hypothetical protein